MAIKINKMATGLGNYQPIEAEVLLVRLSDLDKETDGLDNSLIFLRQEWIQVS